MALKLGIVQASHQVNRTSLPGRAHCAKAWSLDYGLAKCLASDVCCIRVPQFLVFQRVCRRPIRRWRLCNAWINFRRRKLCSPPPGCSTLVKSEFHRRRYHANAGTCDLALVFPAFWDNGSPTSCNAFDASIFRLVASRHMALSKENELAMSLFSFQQGNDGIFGYALLLFMPAFWNNS